ncbi:MAG: DUF1015 domain-containing protein [Alphaproteobacteria bacterium]
MSSIFRPFKALRPSSQKEAKEIIAPPYDVMMIDEAKKYANLSPLSFVHVSRAEVDLSDNIDPHSQTVYNKAAQAMEELCQTGAIVQEESECWYIIQIEDKEGHIQTGFGGVASCQAYDKNIIARHELTRPDKEEDRLNQIWTIGAQTGPVLLTYKPNLLLAKFAAEFTQKTAPFIEAQTPHDGATHRLWIVDSKEDISYISQQFDSMEKLWIADGHHRSAAASRLAKRVENNPNAQWFLSVSFPADEMKLLDYNRLVVDLNGYDCSTFLEKIAGDFIVEKQSKLQKPTKEGQMTLILATGSYLLTYKHEKPKDAAQKLDVAILSDKILAPILNIKDLRVDERIHFAGGARGLSYLEERVQSGKDACAFAMYPTPMTSVMEVADANEIMPPKSTWFEPKLADGLISHSLEK